MQFEILVQANQCPYTSLETQVFKTSISHMIENANLIHLKDDVNRNRFIVEVNGLVIAAILFDEYNICMFRETDSNFRRMGLQSNLWLFAASVLGNISHSEDMTEDGKKAAKIK